MCFFFYSAFIQPLKWLVFPQKIINPKFLSKILFIYFFFNYTLLYVYFKEY